MRAIVQQLMTSMDVLPMTRQDRQKYSELGEKFIARIAENPGTYSYYAFDEWKDALLNLPGSASIHAQSQVLAGFGSTDGQRRLVQLVSAAGVSEHERMVAAKGFEKSINKFGLLLNDKDIQSAYDLYNRLGPNDANIAKVMGRVLDTIEAAMK